MTSTPRHAHDLPQLIGAIWAQGSNGVIGADGAMPWSVPEDLAHFKRVTAGHPVIMGRTTWESFPEKFRPLPGRTNIVLTGSEQSAEALQAAGAVPASSLDEAFELAAQAEGNEEIWVIGGAKVYAQAMDRVEVAVITRLDVEPEGDAYAPQLGAEFTPGTVEPAEGWMQSSSGTGYRFETWIREKD